MIFIQAWRMLKMFHILLGLTMSFQLWYIHLAETIHPTPYGTKLPTGAQGFSPRTSTLHVMLDMFMMETNQKKLFSNVRWRNCLAQIRPQIIDNVNLEYNFSVC